MHNLGAGRATTVTAGQQYWIASTNAATTWDPSTTNQTTLLLPTEEFGAIWENLPVGNVAAIATNVQPAAANYQHPDRFYIHSAKATTQMVNPTNAPVYVTAYYLTPRHDIANAVNFSAGPVAVLQGGLANAVSGGTNPSEVDLAYNIFSNPFIVKNWRIYKVKKVLLHPGQNKTFSLSRKKGFFVDMDRWGSKASLVGANTWSPGYVHTKGVTKWIVYSLKGGMSNDVTPTAAEVSTTPPVVQWKNETIYRVSTVMGGVSTTLNMVSGFTGDNTGILPDPTADTIMTEGANAGATFASV